MAHPICPDCQRRLEGGYLLNGVPASGHVEVSEWIEGPPEKGFWGLKLKNRRRLKVYAWRCPGCAQVRLFAPE